MVFTADGYGALSQERVAVISNAHSECGGALKRGGEISGIIVDQRGAPLPGATVRIDSASPRILSMNGTDGHFTLKNVPHGNHTLKIAHPQYRPQSLPTIAIAENKTTSIRVALHPSPNKASALQLADIGAMLAIKNKRLTIINIQPQSPAAVAGLNLEDIILAINNVTVAQLSQQQAHEALRGMRGTFVRLIIQRKERTFHLELVRDEPKASAASS
jgi:hypothetical protein